MVLQLRRIVPLLPSWASRSIISNKRLLLSGQDSASLGMFGPAHNAILMEHSKPEMMACRLATAAESSIFILWKTLNRCHIGVTALGRNEENTEHWGLRTCWLFPLKHTDTSYLKTLKTQDLPFSLKILQFQG